MAKFPSAVVALSAAYAAFMSAEAVVNWFFLSLIRKRAECE
jgi:hypothetical protein